MRSRGSEVGGNVLGPIDPYRASSYNLLFTIFLLVPPFLLLLHPLKEARRPFAATLSFTRTSLLLASGAPQAVAPPLFLCQSLPAASAVASGLFFSPHHRRHGKCTVLFFVYASSKRGRICLVAVQPLLQFAVLCFR